MLSRDLYYHFDTHFLAQKLAFVAPQLLGPVYTIVEKATCQDF
jgi:hypothetical protein